MNDWNDQSVSQSDSQSVSQSVSESVSQPVSQSASQSEGESLPPLLSSKLHRNNDIRHVVRGLTKTILASLHDGAMVYFSGAPPW